ncbi:MAG: SLC13 family permease, partial [Candidatus Thermoplasmatota archaeon]|nr:SLC13 family permease [Candidatus Thermoplasmatota archaeon]
MFGLKFALSLAIFMITMILVILRPRNLGIGYSALIGGAASVILGITTIPEIIQVWDIVWNATFTFVAIIIMSLIYDEVGFFEYASMKLAGLSGGSGKKFFVLMILLGAVISAFFANDGAVLVLTPIMYSFLSRSGADRKAYLAFIMAVGFISDTASMPFVISNLVNIITSG